VFEDGASLRIGSGAVQMAQVSKNTVNLRTIEGHLPMLLYPGRDEPRDCLGICVGAGQSFGALLRYPLRSLDVVDISGEITTLALRALSRFNNDLARDPRVAVHLDDGRHFVARAPAGSFDVVSMEPAPAIIDGAHSLYTVEFYRDIRRVLRPGGVFMQYMPFRRALRAAHSRRGLSRYVRAAREPGRFHAARVSGAPALRAREAARTDASVRA
jgi:spermidine synthase